MFVYINCMLNITWFSILASAFVDAFTHRPGAGPTMSNHFSSVNIQTLSSRTRFSFDNRRSRRQKRVRLYFWAVVNTSVCHGFCHMNPLRQATFLKLSRDAFIFKARHCCKVAGMLPLFIEQIRSTTFTTSGFSVTGLLLTKRVDLRSDIKPSGVHNQPFSSASSARCITRVTYTWAVFFFRNLSGYRLHKYLATAVLSPAKIQTEMDQSLNQNTNCAWCRVTDRFVLAN